jgi:hypothetical protein
MNSHDFERLKVGDHILVRCVITRALLANEFDRDETQHLEGWEVQSDHGGPRFAVIPDEVAAVARCPHPLHDGEEDFLVGDHVRWCGQDGWRIVHMIAETCDAVILHDDAGRGCRRTALSRLERLT